MQTDGVRVFRNTSDSGIVPALIEPIANLRWLLLVALAISIVVVGTRPAFAQTSHVSGKPAKPAKPATPVAHNSPPTTPGLPDTSSTQTPPSGRPFASGHILVAKSRDGTDADFNGVLNAHGGNSLGRLGNLNVHVVNVPRGREKDIVGMLAGNSNVEFAEVDELVEPAEIVNDPDAGAEWHLATIGAPTAWDTSVGTGITIAILDTGVDGTHPDLAPHLVPGWNFYDNNSNTSDVYGHGTAVAGAAAAIMNNGIGVAGVAGNANIMPLRISDINGYANYSTVVSALSWAADKGARVANISYQMAGSSAVISAANYFRSKGGVVAVSAGNTGALDSTAPSDSMIVVSATDSSDQLASWSTYGSLVDIAAPGASIYTTANGGGFRYASGTSFSSPIVAGAAALILSRRPDFTPAQIDAILKSTATDLGAVGTDMYFGAGRLNVAAAVQAAAGSAKGDSTPPTVAIASPTGGTVSSTVSIAVNAADNVGVTRVELRVNGTTVASDAASPYVFTWNSASVGNGSAVLTAAAFDAAGNSTISAPVSINVSNVTIVADTTPPSVSIAAPNSGGSVVSGTTVVSINATDNVGVTRVDLRVNGTTVATGNATPFQLAWNTTTVANGSATLTAVAYDAAGNSSVSTPIAVTVANNATSDTTPPVLAITSPKNGGGVSGQVTITTSATDDHGTAGITQRLYIDGVAKGSFTGGAISYKWNTSPLASGSHTIVVTATDAAGNLTTQQVQVTKTGK